MRGVELGKTGIYHIAGREIVNRYDFPSASQKHSG